MINSTTLRKLNNTSFGSDINRIELFIKYFDKANYISDLREYNETYDELRKLLKEIKPESQLFTQSSSSISAIQDKYDFNTESYIRNDIDIISKSKHEAYQNIKNNIGNNVNFVCVPYVEGLNVKAIYMNGYIYKIYLCNKDNNYINATETLKSRVPAYIEAISSYAKVALLGKVTIFNNHKESIILDNIICSSLYFVENNIGINNIDLIFDNIIFENNNDNELNNIWDRLEYMRTLGINIVHHALVRDVDTSNFDSALNAFVDYFDNIEKTSGIIYKYNGIEVMELEDLELRQTRFIYNQFIEDNKIFSSKVKSFKTEYDNGRIYIVANIIDVKHNDKQIDSVIIDDICKIDNNEIQVGNEIKFRVYKDKAYAI